MSEPETIFATEGALGRVVLNRPRVLNALSAGQFSALAAQLDAWEHDPAIGAVVIEGAGERAFCAGGDIRVVFDAWKRGDHAFNRSIFRTEYRLDRRIHMYPKPYVALMDGIVMGGGAGVSVNGAFRVATERTVFAMPETGIGFFPDVGATHFLGRCPGKVGLWLGLTGARLGPGDTVWAGLATHFVPAAELEELRAALAVAAAASDPASTVPEVLGRFHRAPEPGQLASRSEVIGRCFGGEGMREIVSSLVEEGSDWAWDTLEDISARSPFSLKAAFRQLTAGRELCFDEAIRREYRLACRFLGGQDFYEGIRAMVVDKDRSAKWTPETLAEVDDRAIEALFTPLVGEEILPLP